MEINIAERVMVFIDLRNVMGITKKFDARGKIDFEQMIDFIVKGRRLIAKYMFDGEGDGGCRRFHDAMRYKGFRVIVRESYDIESDSQKEIDASMICEMLSHAYRDNYDTAIVVSGDRDFRPAIEHIQSLGKRVEVAGFSLTMSEILARSGDTYHDLDHVQLLTFEDQHMSDEEVIEIVA